VARLPSIPEVPLSVAIFAEDVLLPVLGLDRTNPLARVKDKEASDRSDFKGSRNKEQKNAILLSTNWDWGSVRQGPYRFVSKTKQPLGIHAPSAMNSDLSLWPNSMEM